jgi:hypothetical protein
MDIAQDDLSPGRGTVRSRGRRCAAYRTPEGRVRYWPSTAAGSWQYAGGAVAATFQLDGPDEDPPAAPDRSAGAGTAGMTDQVTVDAWVTHHRVRGVEATQPEPRNEP